MPLKTTEVIENKSFNKLKEKLFNSIKLSRQNSLEESIELIKKDPSIGEPYKGSLKNSDYSK